MPQRVLITAGAAGIGREFARAFAATGASVFVCDIDAKALDAAAKEIPGLIARPCDMSRRADIERMVPEAVARLGGLDVLINNAGISGMTLPVADYPPDDWDKVVVIGFTKTLAMELGEWGIRANAIAPGAVEGDRIERVFAGRAQISGRTVEEVRAAAMAEQSIKAMIKPTDIAALAVFLASDAAKSISGQVLPIDNDRQRA